MTSKLRGAIPFPDAGEGVFVRFSAGDIARLEDEYGIGEYFDKIEMNLNAQSAKVTMKCLEVGAKKEVDGKIVPFSIDFEEADWPLTSAIFPIMDALCYQAFGESYEWYINERLSLERRRDEALQELEQKKREMASNDPFPASGESNVSSDTGSEQD